MPKTSSLEEQLARITEEFLSKVVSTIRNASFADVAALSSVPVIRGGHGAAASKRASAVPRSGSRSGEARGARDEATKERPPRQTADKRAELGGRVLHALAKNGAPMGVRALASALGVAPDLLAIPLRELRDARKIAKHGEKRNTTYTVV